MRVRSPVSTLLLWGLCACGPGDAPPMAPSLQSCVPEPEGDLELGAGRNRFESVEAGAELLLTPGFQGGYHLYASVLARTVDPVDVRLDFLVCQEGSPVGLRRPITVDLVDGGHGRGYVGVTVFLHEVYGPKQLADRETTMAAQLIERSGERATDSITFTTRCCDELR